MTVHMVRVYAAKSVTLDQARDAVDNWLAKHTPWSDDPTPHEVRVAEDLESGTEYFQGDFRFEWGDDRAGILDDAETDLGANVAWFRFGYHECDHDDPSGGCSWGEVREGGSVPAFVPDMGVA